MAKKLSKEKSLKHATAIAAYLLIVWGFYRLMFKLPDEIEELIVKPLVWLLPVFFLLGREKLDLAYSPRSILPWGWARSLLSRP